MEVRGSEAMIAKWRASHNEFLPQANCTKVSVHHTLVCKDSVAADASKDTANLARHHNSCRRYS